MKDVLVNQEVNPEITASWWENALRDHQPLATLPALPKGDLRETLYLTDYPEQVFTQSIGYHVTSDSILQPLAQGKAILPPFLHQAAGIVTHRKSALELGDAFLQLFGFDLSAKRAFVFGSPQVDPEQVLIEDYIAQEVGTGIGLDRFSKILFQEILHDEEFTFTSPVVRPEWVEIFQFLALYKGLPEDEFEKRKSFIFDSLQQISRFAGFRDGWFTTIWETLQSKNRLNVKDLTPDSMCDSKYLLDHLLPAYDRWFETFKKSDSDVRPGHALVVEYDLRSIWNLYAEKRVPYPLIRGSRHPGQIHILPALYPEAITGIYFVNDGSVGKEMHILEKMGIAISPAAELPKAIFINTTHYLDIPQGQTNPLNPFCEIRYTQNDPEVLFNSLADQGLIYPAFQ